MLVHMVFFWLKPSTPAAVRAQLIQDCGQILKQVPSVRQLWAGEPAMTPREVVDNSYDVGLCVVFEDRAGHDLYQEHALHKEFIARNNTHWQRVQVYDFA